MGESKRRGSKQERVEQALESKKRKLDEIRGKLGLPENAEFCGYLVHSVDKDEFVHSIEETTMVVKRAFAKTPELAMRFDHFWDAYKYAKEDKGEIVVGLFEVGGEFIVHPVL